MTKLWCALCKNLFPTQAHINIHLLFAHNHKVTPQTEKWWRKLQTRKWEARDEALDLALRQNARNKRIEWEAFAAHPNVKDVPATGMDEKLVREMLWFNEIEGDSESDGSESETEGEDEDSNDTDYRDDGSESDDTDYGGDEAFREQEVTGIVEDRGSQTHDRGRCCLIDPVDVAKKKVSNLKRKRTDELVRCRTRGSVTKSESLDGYRTDADEIDELDEELERCSRKRVRR